MSSRKSIKSAFESMMFTWGEPLDVKTAADVMNIRKPWNAFWNLRMNIYRKAAEL